MSITSNSPLTPPSPSTPYALEGIPLNISLPSKELNESENKRKTSLRDNFLLNDSQHCSITLSKTGVLDSQGVLMKPWADKGFVPLLQDEAKVLRDYLMSEQVILMNETMHRLSFGELFQSYNQCKQIEASIPLPQKQKPILKGPSYLTGFSALYALLVLLPDYTDRLFSDLIEAGLLPKGFFKVHVARPPYFDIRTFIYDKDYESSLSSQDLTHERDIILNLVSKQSNIPLPYLIENGLENPHPYNTGYDRFQMVNLQGGHFKWLIWNVLNIEAMFTIEDVFIPIDALLAGDLTNIVPESHLKINRQGIIDYIRGFLSIEKPQHFSEKALFQFTKYNVYFDLTLRGQENLEKMGKDFYILCLREKKFEASIFFELVGKHLFKEKVKEIDRWVFVVSLINNIFECLTFNERKAISSELVTFITKEPLHETSNSWIVELHRLVYQEKISYQDIYAVFQFLCCFSQSSFISIPFKNEIYQSSSVCYTFKAFADNKTYHCPIYPSLEHSLHILLVSENLSLQNQYKLIAWLQQLNIDLSLSSDFSLNPTEIELKIEQLLSKEGPLYKWIAQHLIASFYPQDRKMISNFVMNFPVLYEVNFLVKDVYFDILEERLEISFQELKDFQGDLQTFSQKWISFLLLNSKDDDLYFQLVLSKLSENYLIKDYEQSFLNGLLLDNVVLRPTFSEQLLIKLFNYLNFKLNDEFLHTLISIGKIIFKQKSLDSKTNQSIISTLAVNICNYHYILAKIKGDRVNKEFSQLIVWLIKQLTETEQASLGEKLAYKCSKSGLLEQNSPEKKMAFLEIFTLKIKKATPIHLWIDEWKNISNEGFIFNKIPDKWFLLHINIGKEIQAHLPHEIINFYEKISKVNFPESYQLDLKQLKLFITKREIQEGSKLSLESFSQSSEDEKKIYAEILISKLLAIHDFKGLENVFISLLDQQNYEINLEDSIKFYVEEVINNSLSYEDFNHIQLFCIKIIRYDYFDVNYKLDLLYAVMQSKWYTIKNTNSDNTISTKFLEQFVNLYSEKLDAQLEDDNELERVIFLTQYLIKLPLFLTSHLAKFQIQFERLLPIFLKVLNNNKHELCYALQTFIFLQGFKIEWTEDYENTWLEILGSRPLENIDIDYQIWVFSNKSIQYLSNRNLLEKITWQFLLCLVEKKQSKKFLEVFKTVKVCIIDPEHYFQRIEEYAEKAKIEDQFLIFSKLIEIDPKNEEQWIKKWVSLCPEFFPFKYLSLLKNPLLRKTSFYRAEIINIVKTSLGLKNIRKNEFQEILDILIFYYEDLEKEQIFLFNAIENLIETGSQRTYVFFKDYVLKNDSIKDSGLLISLWLKILKSLECGQSDYVLKIFYEYDVLLDKFIETQPDLLLECYCYLIQAVIKHIANLSNSKAHLDYIVKLRCTAFQNLLDTSKNKIEQLAAITQVKYSNKKQNLILNVYDLPQDLSTLIVRTDFLIIRAHLISKNIDLIKQGIKLTEKFISFTVNSDLCAEFEELLEIILSLIDSQSDNISLKNDLTDVMTVICNYTTQLNLKRIDFFKVIPLILDLKYEASLQISYTLFEIGLKDEKFINSRNFWPLLMNIVDMALLKPCFESDQIINDLSTHPIFKKLNAPGRYAEFVGKILHDFLNRTIEGDLHSKTRELKNFSDSFSILNHNEEWLNKCIEQAFKVLFSYFLDKNLDYIFFRVSSNLIFKTLSSHKKYLNYSSQYINKAHLAALFLQPKYQNLLMEDINTTFTKQLLPKYFKQREIIFPLLLEHFSTAFKMRMRDSYDNLVGLAKYMSDYKYDGNQKDATPYLKSWWCSVFQPYKGLIEGSSIQNVENPTDILKIIQLFVLSTYSIPHFQFEGSWQIFECIKFLSSNETALLTDYYTDYQLIACSLFDRANQTKDISNFNYLNDKILPTLSGIELYSYKDLKNYAILTLEKFENFNLNQKKIRSYYFKLIVSFLNSCTPINDNETIKANLKHALDVLWKNLLCGYFEFSTDMFTNIESIIDIYNAYASSCFDSEQKSQIERFENDKRSSDNFYLDMKFLLNILSEYATKTIYNDLILKLVGKMN